MMILQDLCEAALRFAIDCLQDGGSFICKFYQGSEDKSFERKLKTIFTRVYREKPEASRNVRFPQGSIHDMLSKSTQASKEGYFVAIHRKGNITLKDTFQSADE